MSDGELVNHVVPVGVLFVNVDGVEKSVSISVVLHVAGTRIFCLRMRVWVSADDATVPLPQTAAETVGIWWRRWGRCRRRR